MKFRFLILLFFLTSCLPPAIPFSDLDWRYSDLRLLSEASTGSPSQDLVALYTRVLGSDLQIRLDLLDVPDEPDSDIYVALDTGPGGAPHLPLKISSPIDWDVLIKIPAQGQPAAYLSSDDYRKSVKILPRAVRIPWQDSIILSLNRSSIPDIRAGFVLEAFLTEPGRQILKDSLGPVRSDALPPGRAPVLLAFWNTLPAYTPALALRRWDGAHTGPFGGRHGLQVLLDSVERTRVPVALLDLKRPTSLSALDFLGGIPQVQALADRNLLILPEAIPGYPGAQNDKGTLDPGLTLPADAWIRAAAESRSTGASFGLNGSQFLFIPQPDGLLQRAQSGQVNRAVASGENILPTDYHLIFIPLPVSQPLRFLDRVIIPLPLAGKAAQANAEGLTLEVRRTLLTNAAQSNPPLLVLGGNLPESEWGSLEIAQSGLSYIANHPWIQPLGPDDLLALRASRSFPRVDLVDESEPLQSALSSLPVPQVSGPLEQTVWKAYESLFASLSPNVPNLARLREAYYGQIGELVAAARWAAHPQSISDCNSDPDGDGIPECILASERFFALFDLEGGRLVLLFARDSTGVHQVIAPSSQFITGLADPAAWNYSAGEASDPAVIPGAFADHSPPWEHYISQLDSGRLTLLSSDGSIAKTFRLSGRGLLVNYRSKEPLDLQVPMAIDPWTRFKPGWGDRYNAQAIQSGWLWGITGGPQVEIRTTAQLDFQAFTSSRKLVKKAENPNYDYPEGHYLPFPLSVVKISGNGEFEIEIDLVSSP